MAHVPQVMAAIHDFRQGHDTTLSPTMTTP